MWGIIFLYSCATEEVDSSTKTSTEQPITLPIPENGYQLTTPSYDVPPYSEVEICTVMRLEPKESETLFWANKLESLVTQNTHHMNVLIGEFSFLDVFAEDGASEAALGVPIGQYPCSELNTMERAYTIFPSQRENQKITLPEGVAAPLTAPLLLVFSHHYINTTDTSIPIQATLNLETITSEEVRDVAGLIFNDIPEIEIPPNSDQVVERTCVVERDVEVALVSSHNHKWGRCATMNHYDGVAESISDDTFFVNKLWDQPPILHFEPGQFSLTAGDGIHWACHYQNNTDQTLINDGSADGEMCVFAAVTYPSTWSVSQVEETVSNGDLTSLFTLMADVMGPCDSVLNTTESPWLNEDSKSCMELQQTESNVIE